MDLDEWEIEAYSDQNREVQYDLYYVNKQNVSYITPADEGQALLFMLDGSVLQTEDPYENIKAQFNAFQIGMN